MTETKTGEAQQESRPAENQAEEQTPKDQASENKPEKEKEKKSTSDNPLTIFYHWCKACNICIALCPHDVFIPDRDGKPIVEHPEKCTQCSICWMHCPDLAIVSNED